MPLYYTRFNNCPLASGAGEGDEYPDDATAIESVSGVLLTVLRDAIKSAEGRWKVSVTITDAAGHCIYAASVTFDGVCLR